MRIEPSLGFRLFPACAMPGHAGLCFRGIHPGTPDSIGFRSMSDMTYCLGS